MLRIAKSFFVLLFFCAAAVQSAGSAATAISASVLIQDITYYDSYAEGALSLEVCNLGLDDLRNVNVRTVSEADRLNQGVVQFGSLDAGSCVTSGVDFSFEIGQFDELGGVVVRVQYDIAGTAHEVIDLAGITDTAAEGGES